MSLVFQVVPFLNMPVLLDIFLHFGLSFISSIILNMLIKGSYQFIRLLEVLSNLIVLHVESEDLLWMVASLSVSNFGSGSHITQSFISNYG